MQTSGSNHPVDFRVWRTINRPFSVQDKRVIIVLALLLEAVIFGLDYITTPHVTFDVFYFAPIAIAGWYVGTASAYLFATLSSLTRAHVFGILFPHGTLWLYAYDFLANSLVFFVFAYLVLQIARLVADLTARSRTDHLTGINNRGYFLEAGAAELLRSLRYKYPVTLVYVDIDDFKHVNDSQGHARGDHLLAGLARGMREGLRAGDILGRMGGDEFAILLPHTNLEQARVFVKRMSEALETFIAPFEPRVTLSIGAAAYLGDKPLTIDELIAMADKGMYSVKKTSKDDAVFSVV